MTDQKTLTIGWASDSITPCRPVYLSGQLYVRVSRYVHDPITATALAIENGAEQLVLISCDMVGISEVLADALKARVDGVEGLRGEALSISVTHTHNASRFDRNGHDIAHAIFLGKDKAPLTQAPDDMLTGQAAEDFWLDKLETIVLRAWRSRKPGGVSWAQDYAAIGFNRRPVFRRGDTEESIMYGACAEDGFRRFEGTTDHTANMLYTWDEKRDLTGVVVGIPCPSQIMELHCFVSADYWDPARRRIRQALGNVYVLPLCEAAGDQNPIDLVRVSKTNKEELGQWGAQVGEVWCNYDLGIECDKVACRIADVVKRGFERAGDRICYDAVLRHEVEKIVLPLRKVGRAEYEEALAETEAMRARTAGRRLTDEEAKALFEPVGVIARWEEQQATDQYAFAAHFIRIGEVAFATSPFELFVEYSLRVRARCAAPQLFMVQLANGVGGYLPTVAAVEGGSYSSKPASTNVGPEGGDELVERYIRHIDALYAREP